MISRCQWWYLTEKGGVCRNMLVTNWNEDCPFSDQTMCPAYVPLIKVREQEDTDVKIFTNPMGEWHASTGNSDYDVISRPSHYAEGRKYEPKDVIRDWGLNFNLGCAVKYISRAGRKDDILQDLKKARQYLDFEIEAIEQERSGSDA